MTNTATASGPRLVPLSVARLAGNGLFRFVYPFLGVVAVDVGLGEGAEGLLITGLAVGGMVLPPVARWLLGDRDAPVRSTTTGLVGLFVGTLLLGGLAPVATVIDRWLGAAVAFVAMVVLGLGKPLLDIGAMTYVSARTDWQRRGRALSIMELTWAGGLFVLAPVGLLAGVVGWRWSLVLLGAVGLATVPLLRRWLDPDEVTAAITPAHPPAATPDGHVVAGQVAPDPAPVAAAALVRRSGTLFLLAITLVFVGLETTFGVVGLWLEDVRLVDAALVSSVAAIGAVGELGGSVFTVAAGDRAGKARTAIVGTLACAAGFGLLGVAGPLWLAIVGLVVGLFGTETAIVAGIALASEVDPTRRSAFLSRMVAVSSVARAVAGGGAALLLRQVGIGANTALSALAAVAAAAALVALVRHDPRLRG